MTWFTQPHNLVFAIALTIVAAFALLEVIGMLVGTRLSEALDHLFADHPDAHVEVPHHAHGFFSGLLEWLETGKLPLMVSLNSFLAVFGLAGFMIQGAVTSMDAAPLSNWIAVPAALLCGLPAARFTNRLLAKMWPGDETSAFSPEALVGRVGVVTIGTATADKSAEVKVIGPDRRPHYVMVFATGEAVPQGGELLLTCRLPNGSYRGQCNTNPDLSRNTIPDIPMLTLAELPAFLTNSITLISVAVVALVLIMLGVLSRFYVRASKELGFVRTGLGGQKVISDGGAVVIPIFQQITPVNMMTLRLLVERAAEEALITFDRMRADVKAEFFVRVRKDDEAIAQAAQCFGTKTQHPEQMRELLQGKFVDALRAVAAGMEMQMLHEKRAEFVQNVQTTVAEDLAKNGLELESVSLTGFDQTSIEYFNASNSFDAQGLANIARITEAKREERNKIEQETRVRIEQKNLEADMQSLQIKREGEFARLAQDREVSMQRAEQEALIKTEQALRRRESEQAEIDASRQIALQNINKEREIQQSKLETQKQIETLDIARRQAVEISSQEAAINLAAKSEQKSRAEAAAAKALSEKVAEEEAVTTVRLVAEANRLKDVAVIAARQEAEKQATAVTVAAEAEKSTAINLADAKLTQSRADAEAVKIRADADQKRLQIEAAGQRAINEAKNVLSEAVMGFEWKRLLSEVAPALVEASVKPMEKIDSIRIISTNGPLLGGGGGDNGGGNASAPGTVPDQLVNALLRHRMQLPLIDDLLRQLGVTSPSADGITSALADRHGHHEVDETGAEHHAPPAHRSAAPSGRPPRSTAHGA